jgi:hypothetical protein
MLEDVADVPADVRDAMRALHAMTGGDAATWQRPDGAIESRDRTRRMRLAEGDLSEEVAAATGFARFIDARRIAPIVKRQGSRPSERLERYRLAWADMREGDLFSRQESAFLLNVNEETARAWPEPDEAKRQRSRRLDRFREADFPASLDALEELPLRDVVALLEVLGHLSLVAPERVEALRRKYDLERVVEGVGARTIRELEAIGRDNPALAALPLPAQLSALALLPGGSSSNISPSTEAASRDKLSPMVARQDIQEAIRALVKEAGGELQAAKVLGRPVSREQVLAILAGAPVREGTLALLRDRLAAHAAKKTAGEGASNGR